jgi:hypothetical protein
VPNLSKELTSPTLLDNLVQSETLRDKSDKDFDGDRESESGRDVGRGLYEVLVMIRKQGS